MQNEEEKNQTGHLEKKLEIVFLIIMAIAIYIGGILFLGKPVNRLMPWFFSPIGFVVVLLADFIWVVVMKMSNVRSFQIRVAKKIVSVFIFALSASLLTLWLILFLWSRFRW